MAKKLTVYFDEVDYFELTSSAEKMKMKPLELVYKRYEEGKEKFGRFSKLNDCASSVIVPRSGNENRRKSEMSNEE